MDADMFARYLEIVNHPTQLSLSADIYSLYLVYRAHVTRFPYQNIDLYTNKPMPDLSVQRLMEEMGQRGGHCFQQSELLCAVLEHLGFEVVRVAAWVLMGNTYQPGMPLNHNILLVKVAGETFLCDPGLSSASPRFPIKLNMKSTEEVTISEGDHYKLEVHESFYELFWMIKSSYLLMYRFNRDQTTGWAETSDKEATLELCKAVYEGPGFIPIRDKYVKVALQTVDSKIDFFFADGAYKLKIFSKGKVAEERDLDYKQFFELIKEKCSLDFEAKEFDCK